MYRMYLCFPFNILLIRWRYQHTILVIIVTQRSSITIIIIKESLYIKLVIASVIILLLILILIIIVDDIGRFDGGNGFLVGPILKLQLE